MAITVGASRVAAGSLCLHAPGRPMGKVRSCSPIDVGLPSILGGVGFCVTPFGPAQRSLSLRPASLPSRQKRPSTSEASAPSLPRPPLRLLRGGANQFPGGPLTHCEPAPFHGAREIRARVDQGDGFRSRPEPRSGAVPFHRSPNPHRAARAHPIPPVFDLTARFESRSPRQTGRACYRDVLAPAEPSVHETLNGWGPRVL